MEGNGSGATDRGVARSVGCCCGFGRRGGRRGRVVGRDDGDDGGLSALRGACPPARSAAGAGPRPADVRSADAAGVVEAAVAVHGAAVRAAHLVGGPSAGVGPGRALTARAQAVGDAAGRPAWRDGHLGGPPTRVGWHTVMRAVRTFGQPLVEDPGRLDGVHGVGVDEHVWATRPAAAPHRVRHRHHRLDPGPAAAAARRGARPHRQGLRRLAARARRALAGRGRLRRPGPVPGLRDCAGHGVARRSTGARRFPLREAGQPGRRRGPPPGPTRHLGHRGHKHDPLYQVRRLLRRGAEHLTDVQRQRLAHRACGRRSRR